MIWVSIYDPMYACHPPPSSLSTQSRHQRSPSLPPSCLNLTQPVLHQIPVQLLTRVYVLHPKCAISKPARNDPTWLVLSTSFIQLTRSSSRVRLQIASDSCVSSLCSKCRNCRLASLPRLSGKPVSLLCLQQTQESPITLVYQISLCNDKYIAIAWQMQRHVYIFFYLHIKIYPLEITYVQYN